MSAAAQEQVFCLLVFGPVLLLALALSVSSALQTIRAARVTEPSPVLLRAIARARRAG